jgi:hypothetical protein
MTSPHTGGQDVDSLLLMPIQSTAVFMDDDELLVIQTSLSPCLMFVIDRREGQDIALLDGEFGDGDYASKF